MLVYVLKKLAYGFLVLFGVITVVFGIFNLGGDPVEQLVSENTTQEVKDAIRKKFNLDLPFMQRYALYLNDVSPLSIHNPTVEESHVYWDEAQYNGVQIVAFSDNRALMIKVPYLSRSYLTERPVSEVLGEALPGTIVLATTAITIAIVLGLLLGIISALNKDTWIDQLTLALSTLGMSGPSFFMAILIAWLGGLYWYESTSLPILPFAIFILFLATGIFRKYMFKKANVELGKMSLVGLLLGFGFWGVAVLVFGSESVLLGGSLNLPGTGLSMSGSLFGVDVWEGRTLQIENLILPAITLGIRPLAVIVQLTRGSLLEVMGQDYIRTARAKGLSEWQVILRHALKNALNPVITAISGWFASLLAGAVFVEFVFGWKGLGLETYSALEQDDLPVVMGAVILIAATFVVVNLVTDVLYGVVDPRVRVS